MKVFITGGAGFLGSHIADTLLKRGDAVLSYDNYSTGRRDSLVPGPGLTVVEGDIADKAALDAAFDAFAPDVVVHAAASYKDPDDWEEDVRSNVLGTINVVRASRRTGVGRFIYLQTALCYGLHPVEQPITLRHPYFSGGYNGGSSYAISKTAGEQYVELSGLDFISFRLATALGPRNMNGAVPTFYQRLKAGKPCFVADTRRDFLYFQDLVDVVVMALDGKGEKGFYNISSGLDYAIKEVFDEVVDAMGLDAALKDSVEVRPRGEDDAYSILLDPAKTQRDFGWKSGGTLKQIVRSSIDYYDEYGVEETYTHLRGLGEEK